jgi:hypothetical protein
MNLTVSEKKNIFTELSRHLNLTNDEKSFLENVIVRFSLLGALLLNAASWIVLVIFIRREQAVVILHYNVYFGVDLIGDWQQVYLLPAIGLLFLTGNTLLAGWFYGRLKERIGAYLLLLASLIVEFGVLIASGSVAFINY